MFIFSGESKEERIKVLLEENPDITGTYDPKLKRLDLSLTKINDEQLIFLMQFLTQNPDIKQLSLYNNKITDKGVILLAQNTTLEHLDLGKNFISQKGCVALAKNTHLRSLNLSYNLLGNLGARAFLSGNNTIKDLNLSGNHLGDEIVESIIAHPSLSTLSLHENSLTDKGIIRLAHQSKLNRFDISKNLIGAKGAVALAESKISYLNLSNNLIGKSGSHALTLSTNILELQARHCGIQDDEASEFLKNKTLLSLDITNNPGNTNKLQSQLKVVLKSNRQNYEKALKERAALTYYGLLLINLQNNELPYLPIELIDMIADFSNATVSEVLSSPLPSIAKLKTDSNLAKSNYFFVKKNDNPRIQLSSQDKDCLIEKHVGSDKFLSNIGP